MNGGVSIAAGAAAYGAASGIGALAGEGGLAALIGVSATGIGIAVAAVAATVLWILDLFGFDLFGGGSATVIPPGYYRLVHYVLSYFLGVPYGLTPNMGDSVAYEAPFGGKIIWISGPASPPSACSYYDQLCAQSGNTDSYACSAGQCCRDYGNGPVSNCVRGCLIQEDQRACFSFLNPFKDLCREDSHLACFQTCGNPGLPPPSCWSTLLNTLF